MPNFLKDFFSYSRAERTGVLVLLAVLFIIIIIPSFLPEKKQENNKNRVDLKKQVDTFEKKLRLQAEANKPKRFEFDPNTADSTDFCALGFSPAQTAVILNYRAKGGAFYNANDFARMYVVPDTVFSQLKPYIRIAKQKTAKKQPTIELNTADSIMLVQLQGIGGYYAKKIIDRRTKLGGFVSVEQLIEIYGIDEERLNQFKQQVRVDSLLVKKIDINTAKASDLRNHPYFDDAMVRQILKLRKKQGRIESINQLVNEKIITTKQGEKIAAYLKF